jgi:hypothetical protein
MARRWTRNLLLMTALLGTVGYFGCSKKPTGVIRPEAQAPETELTYAPLEGDTSTFRIHFFWNGYDKDGEVTRFRYAVDADTARPFQEWISTVAKDTTLLFLVDPVTEIRGHVFWVVAEDNSGNFDLTPAKRFFSAKTLPPTSRITSGPNAPGTSIGPNFTFEWEGIDPDGGETGGPAPVDSFEYLMLQVEGQAEVGHPKLPPYRDTGTGNPRQVYIDLIVAATGPTLNPPYDDWKWVGIRGTRKRFRNVTPEHFFFAVRAVDIAGATEKIKTATAGNNIRDFNVTNRNPGPLMQICSSVLVECLAATSGPDDIPRKEIQIFEGEIISFAWSADASTYGGEIVGFTYALDDTTIAEWSSVDITKTGVTLGPSQLSVGPHFLFVKVVDDGGLVTNQKIPLRIVHPLFKDPPSGKPLLLYVDDFAPPPGDWSTADRGSPNYPADDDTLAFSPEDQWWSNVILNPLAQEFGFVKVQDAQVHDTVYGGAVSIQGRSVFEPLELANYRTIIWYTDFNNTLSSPTALWKTLVGGSYSELAGYLRAGGTLILTGFQIANGTSGLAAPYITYSRGMCSLDEGSREWRLSYFPRNFMGMDGALRSDDAVRPAGARDFVEARVTPQGAAMGFVTAAVDTGSTGSGAKWNPNAFPGQDRDQAHSPGLPKIEGWRLATDFGCFPPNVQVLVRKENSGPISVPIFTYHGVPRNLNMDGGPSPREGLVVGIATQAHDLGNGGGGGFITPSTSAGAIGRMVVLGFPIYYMKDPEAYQIMRAALAYVNASPTLPGYTP